MSGEFESIAAIRSALPGPPPGETWIGDDAAVLRGPEAGSWLLLCADTVVAGVHADLSLTSLGDFGWKAVVANISDIAAMGGAPGHAVVTVAGPPSTDLAALYAGIAEAAATYSCPVVGGDLSGAPTLVVTVAVTGSVAGEPVLRSGAHPGDGIWVTGALGGAAAGLRAYRRLDTSPQVSLVRKAHARPVPAVAEGTAARLAGATAMIDVSDGFGADLGHVADASRVGFVLDAVPVADGATLAEALGGGEDYVLIFCAPDDEAVRTRFAGLPSPARIGSCVEDPATRILAGKPLSASGWQHRWQAKGTQSGVISP